jgi:hypothetical protein
MTTLRIGKNFPQFPIIFCIEFFIAENARSNSCILLILARGKRSSNKITESLLHEKSLGTPVEIFELFSGNH